jgi:hypothetical protein
MQDDQTRAGNFCMVEEGLLRPWTVLVLRGAVVGIYPWNTRDPILTHAAVWARSVGAEVGIYEVEERQPAMELGASVDPAGLGWVEVARHEPMAQG